MPSEMQERIARAIYDAPTTFDGDQIAVHLGLSMNVDEAADSVEKVYSIVMGMCMDAALAVMKAMLEPTPGMHLAGELVPDGIGGCPPSVGRIYRAMLSHEIAAAEEAR